MQTVNGTEVLEPIVFKVLPDGKADVWLRRNHDEDIDEDGNPVYTADEVYFQVEAAQVAETDMKNDFEKWWNYGEGWSQRDIDSDIILSLVAAQSERTNMLEECILEMSGILYS